MVVGKRCLKMDHQGNGTPSRSRNCREKDVHQTNRTTRWTDVLVKFSGTAWMRAVRPICLETFEFISGRLCPVMGIYSYLLGKFKMNQICLPTSLCLALSIPLHQRHTASQNQPDGSVEPRDAGGRDVISACAVALRRRRVRTYHLSSWVFF